LEWLKLDNISKSDKSIILDMNLKYHYWYFKSALSNQQCDDIINVALKQKEDLGLIGNLSQKQKLNKKEIKDLKKKRNSNIVWLDLHWIYKLIQPYVMTANKNSGWNFDWDFSESAQFTKYKLNQFYDWHCDSWNQPYDRPDNKDLHGKIRKLSVTVSLSDAKDYKGGNLEFDLRNEPPNSKKKTKIICKEIMPKGSIVVFPSFIWHRVKPITKGTRYSLVMWNCGYPFK
jgi:PKHD-type hydroxylase